MKRSLTLALAALFPISAFAQAIQFSFNSTQPVHAAKSDSFYQYTYDANGNLKNQTGPDGTTTYEYTTFNKIKQVVRNGQPIAGYLYDVNGSRIAKTDGSGNILERYFGEIEKTQSGTTKYYFLGGQRVAKRIDNGSLYFMHQDHLGSSSVVTDAGGNLVSRTDYYEYGAVLSETGVVNDPHKYNDKRLDLETNHFDYDARSYSAKSFRFTTPDSIVPDSTDPQSFNRYAYVQNNPLKYIDPTGHAEKIPSEKEVSMRGMTPQETKMNRQQWADDLLTRYELYQHIGFNNGMIEGNIIMTAVGPMKTLASGGVRAGTKEITLEVADQITDGAVSGVRSIDSINGMLYSETASIREARRVITAAEAIEFIETGRVQPNGLISPTAEGLRDQVIRHSSSESITGESPFFSFSFGEAYSVRPYRIVLRPHTIGIDAGGLGRMYPDAPGSICFSSSRNETEFLVNGYTKANARLERYNGNYHRNQESYRTVDWDNPDAWEHVYP